MKDVKLTPRPEVDAMTDKQQLHVSMLEMISRCGVQFQRRFGARFGLWEKEEIVPPGIALATGISVHKAVEDNLKNKIESEGQLLAREQIATIADEEFRGIWQGGMMLTDDESVNVKKTLGSAVDQTIALSLLHYDNLAPLIMPVAVEEKFVISMNDYPYDLSGKKDVREANAIRDTKTKAASPPDNAAHSLQMAMYAMSEIVAGRGLPKKVYLDFLVKTKTPKVVIREAVPDESWMNPLQRRIERAIEIIQAVKEGKVAFTPADTEHWCCSKKFCGYATTCPYWGGK